METKICKKCGRLLPLDSFRIAHRGECNREWACIDCIESKPENMSMRQFRRLYDTAFKEKTNLLKRNSLKGEIPYKTNMLRAAKRRAERKNIEFTLTVEDIVIPDICPILLVPIVKGNKGDYEYSPSLDRIDNSIGYTKDNIMIISKKANSMKNSATTQELINFCNNILRYSPSNTES